MAAARITTSKTPPYSVHAEKVVIGSILRQPALLEGVRALLPNGRAFFRPEHGRMYDLLLEVVPRAAAEAGDSLIEAMSQTKRLDAAGGPALARELLAAALPSQAMDQARLVSQKHQMRCLIEALSEMIHDAYHSTDGFEAVLKRAKKRLNDLRK